MEWHKRQITSTFKKVDPFNYEYYKAITLLKATYKMLMTLIRYKLFKYIEQTLRQYQ